MARVLFIGHSRIAQRRVIPALIKASPSASIAVASRSTPASARSPQFRWYDDYETALKHDVADVAYITLHNSAHAEWVERALDTGLHVVVDKPAFMSLDIAKQLVSRARQRSLLLAESTVFMFHPQFDVALASMDPAWQPVRLAAMFSFPELPSSDFRNRADLGGGALWDLGPYAAATSRIFFRQPPTAVHAVALGRNEHGVINGFSVLMTYGDGGGFVGHFGFGTAYINSLSIAGRNVVVKLERAFTAPPDAAVTVVRINSGGLETISVAATDSFEQFWRAILDAADKGGIEIFAEALIKDAQLLERFRQALIEN